MRLAILDRRVAGRLLEQRSDGKQRDNASHECGHYTSLQVSAGRPVSLDDGMEDGSAPRRFAPALDGLVDRIKGDQSIHAAMLCGSLSHDTGWAQ